MKSLVTMRMVSAGPIGVSGPPGPLGALETESTTGVVPLQWYVILSPDDLRGAAGPARDVGSQAGLNAVQQRGGAAARR